MLRVRAIILNEYGKVLLGKNYENLYVLPGGRIKEGEHPVDALLREIKEETGFTEYNELEYLWFYANNYVFLYYPKNRTAVPNNMLDPSKEFQSLDWFDFGALPKLDEWAEDIIYRFLRLDILPEEKPAIREISAGHIDILVDGKKVFELDDDTIWETLPKLAQERSKGRKIDFRQVLDDGTVIDQTANPMPVKSSLNASKINQLIDELLIRHIPEQKIRPVVEIVSDTDFLAKTVWRKRDGLPPIITVLVSNEITGNGDILRQVLAHEIIHVHLYEKFGKKVARHGEHFNYWADKINEIEGENYVSQYADDTNFQVTGDSSILVWAEDPDEDDIGDALEHINLQRNRQMSKGFSDLDLIDIEMLDPRKVLPAQAFRGKTYGWLKDLPKEEWVGEFKKAFGRDISYILKASDTGGISPVIMIDKDLGDGFARTQLAYSLGEYVFVAGYKGIV